MPEGDPVRGCERILGLLDAETRGRYCSEALEAELRSVRAELGRCAEAMAHARQVGEATQQLLRTAEAAIQVAVQERMRGLLPEMEAYRATFECAVQRLIQVSHRPLEAATQELARLEKILKAQRRSSWLNDALDCARRLVRGLPAESDCVVDPVTAKAFRRQVVAQFRILRRALVENLVTHVEEVPAFQKTLRRLVKKWPSTRKFVEKSRKSLDAALQEHRATTTDKEDGTRATCGEASDDYDVEIIEPPSEDKPAPLSQGDLTMLVQGLRDCTSLVRILTDAFHLQDFDASLKLAVEVVNGLGVGITAADTMALIGNLQDLIGFAERVADRAKRCDRLTCLRSLLEVVVTFTKANFPHSRSSSAAEESLVKCRRLLEVFGAPSSSAAVTGKRHCPRQLKPKQPQKKQKSGRPQPRRQSKSGSQQQPKDAAPQHKEHGNMKTKIATVGKHVRYD